MGVIQLDGRGYVTFYSAGESRLSGRFASAVIGQDFFRDVAPCTHLPGFHGRFLEGVRTGHLNETFRFVFGFEPVPIEVEVYMRMAATLDRYWIVVQPLGIVASSRQRVAGIGAEAVQRRSRAEPVDPSVCEREPIHTPGAVQPHVVMLALNPETLLIEACSDNVGDLLQGATPATVIGEELETAIAGGLSGELRAAVASGLDDPARPWRRTLRVGTTPVAVAAHIYQEHLLLEIERLPERPEDYEAASPLQAQDAVTAVRKAVTLRKASEIVASEIRAMTWFERVLVYQFDAEWNGEAIAESRVSDWEQSLLGLRFPASDIPALTNSPRVPAEPRRQWLNVDLDRDRGPPLGADYRAPSSASLRHA